MPDKQNWGRCDSEYHSAECMQCKRVNRSKGWFSKLHAPMPWFWVFGSAFCGFSSARAQSASHSGCVRRVHRAGADLRRAARAAPFMGLDKAKPHTCALWHCLPLSSATIYETEKAQDILALPILQALMTMQSHHAPVQHTRNC